MKTMPINTIPFLRQIVSDALIVIILQITTLPTETSIKLQLAALSGSMLAVRMLDGKKGFWDWLRVAFSGLVVANYTGLYLCESRKIDPNSATALFYFLLIGLFSDILIRACKRFGDTFLSSIPDLTTGLIDRLKTLIKPK